MQINGEIKQSHIKHPLFFSVLYTEDFFGFNWVRHWAKFSRWLCVKHMQYMKGWVKISKILNTEWNII